MTWADMVQTITDRFASVLAALVAPLVHDTIEQVLGSIAISDLNSGGI